MVLFRLDPPEHNRRLVDSAHPRDMRIGTRGRVRRSCCRSRWRIRRGDRLLGTACDERKQHDGRG
jgi:hypothetical protein